MSIITDGYCGEPIAWGRDSQGPDEILKDNEHKECIHLGYGEPVWIIVEKYLTREEAIQKYGAITNEEFGPRGGWKSVTFGDKKFINRNLKEGWKMGDKL